MVKTADLLARSAANKERYNKERLASYYKYDPMIVGWGSA
jgi:hypothetical protein